MQDLQEYIEAKKPDYTQALALLKKYGNPKELPFFEKMDEQGKPSDVQKNYIEDRLNSVYHQAVSTRKYKPTVGEKKVPTQPEQPEQTGNPSETTQTHNPSETKQLPTRTETPSRGSRKKTEPKVEETVQTTEIQVSETNTSSDQQVSETNQNPPPPAQE